ncbi:MAG: hypothetical protein IJO22_02095, partial [Oscillospiraceae bacterium]|nr:hypothetical protein [Oscillospiraceae bacterium]
DFGKNFAAGCVDSFFFTFDGTPFGMSGHYKSLLGGKISLQIILTYINGFCKPFLIKKPPLPKGGRATKWRGDSF